MRLESKKNKKYLLNIIEFMIVIIFNNKIFT